MAVIRQTDSPAQTGAGIPDEAPGPGEDVEFEAQLERAEERPRTDRDHRFMTEHPDGLGPTLGQDLGKPNPGHAVEWDDGDYDPPT